MTPTTEIGLTYLSGGLPDESREFSASLRHRTAPPTERGATMSDLASRAPKLLQAWQGGGKLR